MASAQLLKQQLLYEIEKLPEHKLTEVLDFAQFLASRETAQPILTAETTATDDNLDPLQAFIGGVSHGSLADRVDEDLYGT